MPWQALIEQLLRIHLLQQWYSLSDPAMEEALIEVPTMRRFTGIELISDRIPDETTILTFRHLLEKHGLGEQVFETVKAHLSERGMTMRQGTIVDATLIAAPSSTKNKEGKRDPEMHQTKKGNQWSHRYKDSWLIHSVVVTAANVHDITPAAELLHADEKVVDGDAGYQASQKGLKWQARQRNSGWRCDPGQAQGLTRHTRRPGCAAWPYRGQRHSFLLTAAAQYPLVQSFLNS